MTPYDRFVHALDQAGCKPKPRGPKCLALCPAHNDTRPSLSVRETEEGHVLICCNSQRCPADAIVRALGLRQADLFARDGFGKAHARKTDALAVGANEQKQKEKNRRRALELIEQSVPLDGAAVRYLRERGLGSAIECDALSDLRWIPRLRHWWTGTTHPAIVAGVRDSTGVYTATQVGYIAADGRGKADVHPQRVMFGRVLGAAVRLGLDSARILIAEGIESALAAGLLVPDRTPWAALSATGMRNVVVPPSIESVVIVADNDPSGVGRAAARHLRRRLRDAGIAARIFLPSLVGADANDVLLKGGDDDVEE